MVEDAPDGPGDPSPDPDPRPAAPGGGAGVVPALRLVAVSILACAGLGLVLGLLWWFLAPRVPMEVVGDVAVPDEYQPGGFVAAEGVFAALAVVAGLGVTGFLLWRGHGPLRVLAAGVLGGLVGSVVMGLTGAWLGRVDVVAVVAASDDGAVFDGPLDLRMPGLLLLWSIASASLVTAATIVDWWIDRRERRHGSAPTAVADPG